MIKYYFRTSFFFLILYSVHAAGMNTDIFEARPWNETTPDYSQISQIDSKRGVNLPDYITLHDKGRTSLSAYVNSDLRSALDLYTFEFTFARKFEYAWVEGFLSRTIANFDRVTESNFNIDTDTELEGTSENITSFGGGISYRTTYIRQIFDSDKLFETASANLVYHIFSENLRNVAYKGFGLKTDFGIHRRISKSMHYGFKFSYNLALVKKPASSDNQPSSQRSLTLTWLSLGGDISFYF